MQCPHCLRGTAQRIDMNLEYVKKLFSQVKFLGSLTLTGGEPSLVPNIIDEIID
jgi:MoaA/NifB/PqqE/SkfB family radical SAM enzyme